jgi:hypothetical protein
VKYSQGHQAPVDTLHNGSTAIATTNSAASYAAPTNTMDTTAPPQSVTTSNSSSGSSNHVPQLSADTTWQRFALHNEPTSTATAYAVSTADGDTTADTMATAATAATAARKRSLEHMYDEQAVFDTCDEAMVHERQRANSLSAIQVSSLNLYLYLFIACSTICINRHA